ncbi:MAG: ATPase [Gammaproteobacteria bacterium]|nr:ATPase [Gammaproteobacteria bacterium]
MSNFKINIDSKQLFLGVDGGGSKCKAKIISSDSSIQGVGISGRANPVQGIDVAQASILEACNLAIEDAGLPPEAISKTVAGVGLAGVNIPSVYHSMSDWNHPFKKLHLTTDLHIACLGAHESKNGAVIICGTGSCGIAIDGDNHQVWGAHGLPLGDQGGGAWLGQKAIISILLAEDGLGPQTSLTGRICNQLKTKPHEITELMLGQPSKEYAKLAPLVLQEADAGDPMATSIVSEGADYLASIVEKISTLYDDMPISIIGGLSEQMMQRMPTSTQEKIQAPAAPPEDGALYFAWQNTKIPEQVAF